MHNQIKVHSVVVRAFEHIALETLHGRNERAGIDCPFDGLAQHPPRAPI